MSQPAAKLCVSVSGELAEAVRKRVGARGLSGFVARALAHELQREGVGALLADLEEELGAPSKTDMARARKAWSKRLFSILKRSTLWLTPKNVRPKPNERPQFFNSPTTSALVRVPAPVLAEVCRGVRYDSAVNHLLNNPGIASRN